MPRYDQPRKRGYGEVAMDGLTTLAKVAGGAAMASFVPKLQRVGREIGNTAGNLLLDSTHAAQEFARRGAERAAEAVSGGAAMDIGESSVIPAQFIYGRGAETAFTSMNILPSIKFKTGESVGAKMTNAWGRERMMFKPQNAMHAFAFKMQLTPPSFESVGTTVPVSRFVVHHVYRHVLSGPNNTGSFLAYGKEQTTWNNTLGPDSSYVRKLGATQGGVSAQGTAYSLPPATSGLTDNLRTPYRYPQNGAFMFPRMGRRLMENLGWNANPMKVAHIEEGSGSLATTVGMQVYDNANDFENQDITSMPQQLPRTAQATGQSYTYRSQFGRGQVSYQFHNDGTNPVVVDVVITRLKKGHDMTKGELTSQMVEVYQRGYLNYSYANQGQANLSGQPPVAEDVTTNSRGTFLPAKALDNYRLTEVDQATTNSSQQPFKQVARDQFILAGGSTRNWSMFLQAIDYKANAYTHAGINQTNQTSATYDDANSCVDDLSYIVSWAISGVPAPYIEFNKGTNYPLATAPLAAVIDRRGTDCSVSVTGAYKEICHPVYLALANRDTWINGRLDVPFYDNAAYPNKPTLTTNDIANVGQATRSAANDTALISLGPLNTVGGG